MRELKIIQVNIFKGKYLDNLVKFIKEEDPDLITMQEVTAGNFNLYEEKSANVFNILKEKLGYFGVFNGDLKIKNDSKSEFGNAVFSKYEIISKAVIVLKPFREITMEELDGNGEDIRELIPRHLLDAVIKVEGNKIHVISWHGAWTAPPTDTNETLKQADKVAAYLDSLDDAFLLGGDLNNIVTNKTVGTINKVANNLMINSGVVQTTHPTIHKIAPKGFMIDYIFTSSHFKLKNLYVPQIIVSDHLPVIVEVKFNTS